MKKFFKIFLAVIYCIFGSYICIASLYMILDVNINFPFAKYLDELFTFYGDNLASFLTYWIWILATPTAILLLFLLRKQFKGLKGAFVGLFIALLSVESFAVIHASDSAIYVLNQELALHAENVIGTIILDIVILLQMIAVIYAL